MKRTYIVLLTAIMPLFAFGIEGLGVHINTAKPSVFSAPSAADANPGMVVEVEIAVSAKGIVEDVQVLRADAPGFAASVTETVMDWKFTPALKNGKPVKSYITVPFQVAESSELVALR